MNAFTVAWFNMKTYGFKTRVGEILSLKNTFGII